MFNLQTDSFFDFSLARCIRSSPGQNRLATLGNREACPILHPVRNDDDLDAALFAICESATDVEVARGHGTYADALDMFGRYGPGHYLFFGGRSPAAAVAHVCA